MLIVSPCGAAARPTEPSDKVTTNSVVNPTWEFRTLRCEIERRTGI
jgi:hypothetical protein